jgi:hypothetical protein
MFKPLRSSNVSRDLVSLVVTDSTADVMSLIEKVGHLLPKLNLDTYQAKALILIEKVWFQWTAASSHAL